MKFFTHGEDVLHKLIHTPTTINELNKIEGGLWGFRKEEHYSDPFIISLIVGKCEGCIMCGFEYEIETNFPKVLELSLSNYKEYMNGESLDLEKVCKFNAIIYKEDLVLNVREFQYYFVECVQIFNTCCIEGDWQTTEIDSSWIKSDEFSNILDKVQNRMNDSLYKTEIYKKFGQYLSLN